MIINIINGNVLDPVAGEIIGERSIVVENDVIVDVLEGQPSVTPDLEIDGRGRYVLPGFIDAHVHLSMTTMNFGRALRLSEVEWSLGMAGWPKQQYSGDSQPSGIREEPSGDWCGRFSADCVRVQG